VLNAGGPRSTGTCQPWSGSGSRSYE
jgi:hypothetical protein